MAYRSRGRRGRYKRVFKAFTRSRYKVRRRKRYKKDKGLFGLGILGL